MKIALIGNPSVGKSLIFNQLTGIGVEVSNYPGTTVELKGGSTCYQREIIDVVDLPGIYSLDGSSEEEVLVRRFLERGEADVVIVIMDATHLERNLYLLVQVAEFGIPMVAVLNIMDELVQQGLEIDTDRLSKILGITVVPTAASIGQNIEQIIPQTRLFARQATIQIPYDRSVEAAIRSLEKMHGAGRSESIWALQGIGTSVPLLEDGSDISQEIEERHKMTVSQIIAANRHNFAREISASVIGKRAVETGYDLDRVLTSALPGIPILVLILFSILVTVFLVGGFLEQKIVLFFEIYFIEPLFSLGLDPLIEKLLHSILLAFQAGLGIALPFIFVFYILVSVLEDTGYLTRAAFLADNAMHRVGMHGGAIIPLVLGLGCNVPALMGLRMMRSKRERLIGSFLITMVPCSARTVIILGIVAAFVSLTAAFSIYLVVIALIIISGIFLSRYMPGQQFGLIMEMAPLRKPKAKLVIMKSWLRLREFLFIAMPLLLFGSVFLGMFEFFGITTAFQEFFAPFTERVLGLPSYTITALLFGILRKEMAFETLVILAGTADLSSVMTNLQLYIFAVVSVLFIPCISTIAVLIREMGIRITVAVTVYTVTLGILIGALINYIGG
jgi:ferrous iron transport protein B